MTVAAVKAKRRAVTASPRVAEQKYPTATKAARDLRRARGALVVPRPSTAARGRRRRRSRADTVDLSVDLGRGLVLPNPILVASGTFGYGVEYGDVVDVDRLGGICCKGTTLKPRIGNPTPRVTETPGGMLNSIGLQNPGVDAVIEKYAETWTTWKTPVIVNVAGESVHDYVEVARRLDGVPGVAAIELNISCPNVGAGGLQFAIDAGAAAEVTAAVRRATDLPLLVKLSPNVADIRPIARAIADAGADALTAINTLSGIAVAPGRGRPLLGNIYGGLCGTGGQAGRPAGRLRGGPGGQDPGRRHRRRDEPRRRARLPRGRRRRGPGRHRDLRRPDAAGPPGRRAGGGGGPARHDVLPRPDRDGAPEEGRASRRRRASSTGRRPSAVPVDGSLELADSSASAGPPFVRSGDLRRHRFPLRRDLRLARFDPLGLGAVDDDRDDLGADQEHQPGQVQPDHQDHDAAERAVGRPVVGHVRDIEGESEGRDEPADREHDRAGRQPSARRAVRFGPTR